MPISLPFHSHSPSLCHIRWVTVTTPSWQVSISCLALTPVCSQHRCHSDHATLTASVPGWTSFNSFPSPNIQPELLHLSLQLLHGLSLLLYIRLATHFKFCISNTQNYYKFLECATHSETLRSPSLLSLKFSFSPLLSPPLLFAWLTLLPFSGALLMQQSVFHPLWVWVGSCITTLCFPFLLFQAGTI